MKPSPQRLSPNLIRIEDTCNVYLVTRGPRAIAIDFGSGAWLSSMASLGIEQLDHVFLTHHHADQCAGLQTMTRRAFTAHAPGGEERFLDPSRMQDLVGETAHIAKGCPESYSVLPGGISGVKYDMTGFSDVFWGDARIRFLHTPGHGPSACSIIVDVDGKQAVFCGDAFHHGGTLWEPFNLEWDHWTGKGALAAWEGVERLRGIRVDLLCPSHGPVVSDTAQHELALLSRRLMAFYHAKGQISPNEPDLYLAPAFVPGARLVLPKLYQFGGNGYLLLSENNEALIVDPYNGDMPMMETLLETLPDVRPTAMVVSHYHYDHCDAIPYLRRKYGAKAYLHPIVASPLRSPRSLPAPWLLPDIIEPDELWPERGKWQWNEYGFQVAAWAGQTWGHCVFMTIIDGKKVAFGGDSFQPTSRWNGTGGFCAYNRSRFLEGFVDSARLILSWQPEIIVNGHGTYMTFSPSKFKKIIQWARKAEKATRALCPAGDLERHYYNTSAAGVNPHVAFDVW